MSFSGVPGATNGSTSSSGSIGISITVLTSHFMASFNVTKPKWASTQMWASLFFNVIQPGTFFSSTGLGTMGWGFPAAIGAKVAKPDVPSG